jgi:hypothetical protein
VHVKDEIASVSLTWENQVSLAYLRPFIGHTTVKINEQIKMYICIHFLKLGGDEIDNIILLL